MIPPDFIISSSDFHIRHTISLAAIFLLMLEYVATCRFEFTYIWSRPLNISKVLFIISRYYDLICKVVNYFLIHFILARSPVGISADKCAIWYTILYTEAAVMIAIMDIILFLRVYALHRKNDIILSLGIPVLTPFALGAYVNWHLVVHRQDTFDGVCNVITFHDLRYFRIGLGTSLVMSHGAIWLCGFLKRNTGQGRVPVVRLVVHECTWIFVALVGLVAAILPAGIASGVINPYYHFFLPTTVLSMVNCRIIQNMHTLALDTQQRQLPQEDSENDFRLTTFIQTECGTEGCGAAR